MRRWFTSDLHLDEGAANELRTQAFLGWLQMAATAADEIYLLGDVFEMWVGDDDDAPLARQVRAALADAATRTTLYLLSGNRDFLLGDAFATAAGLTLLDDHARLDDGTLVCHGDTLCTDDLPYQQLRAVLHSAAWQAETLAKPLDERRAMGQAMRGASQDANAFKAENIMDANPQRIAELCAEYAAPVIVHGHTHRPGIQRTPRWERYTLGAWERCGWWLEADPERSVPWQLRCAGLAQLAAGV